MALPVNETKIVCTIGPASESQDVMEEIIGDQGRASVTFSRLPQAVKPGDTLYINDGLIQLEVENIAGNH